LPGASRFRGGFARNVALLSGGTVLAQLVNLAAAPLITRFYAPSDVGQFALFASFLGIACVAVALRYELAIIVSIDEREAAQLVFLSIAFSIPFSVALTLLLYALIRFQLLGFGVLPVYAAWLMAPALFLTGAFTTLRYWAVRQERFGTISRAAVWQNGARSAVQTFLGLFRPGALGLLVGEVCGRGFGLEAMLRQAFPVVRRHVARSRLADFRRTLKEHRKFPIFSLPSSLIDTVSMNACVPLLALLYGSGVAGHFALVQRVMALPVFLLATNIADVFHSRLALYARETPEQCAPLFRRTALGLFLLGIIPAAGLVLLGRPLFSLVFGSQWAMAGAMAGLVAPWFLGQFVVSPLSRAVLVLRGQEFKLIYDIFTLLSIGGVFWMARYYSFSPMRAVVWLSIVNTVAYVAYFLVLIYLVSRVTHSRDAFAANALDEALAFPESQERMAG
jgi:O-antigen/teichoic acid export membrane protein